MTTEEQLDDLSDHLDRDAERVHLKACSDIGSLLGVRVDPTSNIAEIIKNSIVETQVDTLRTANKIVHDKL